MTDTNPILIIADSTEIEEILKLVSLLDGKSFGFEPRDLRIISAEDLSDRLRSDGLVSDVSSCFYITDSWDCREENLLALDDLDKMSEKSIATVILYCQEEQNKQNPDTDKHSLIRINVSSKKADGIREKNLSRLHFEKMISLLAVLFTLLSGDRGSYSNNAGKSYRAELKVNPDCESIFVAFKKQLFIKNEEISAFKEKIKNIDAALEKIKQEAPKIAEEKYFAKALDLEEPTIKDPKTREDYEIATQENLSAGDAALTKMISQDVKAIR